MNHSLTKSRTATKRVNNSARKSLKGSQLRDQLEAKAQKARRKNPARQVPAAKIDISSLTTSRDNSTEPSSTKINRSLLLEGSLKLENAMAIRIEEECSVGNLCDAAEYVKGKIAQSVENAVCEEKILKLKEENKELKMRIEARDAELKKKDRKVRKEKKFFKRIQDRIEDFAQRFDKALSRLEQLCASQADLNARAESSVRTNSASSSLATPGNCAADSSLTSESFCSPKIRNSLRLEMISTLKAGANSSNKCPLLLQSSKKNTQLYKEMLKAISVSS